MDADHRDQHFHIPGEDCRDRSADHPERRCAEFPVDQDIIEQQIYNNSCYSRFHGQQRLPALAQRARIDLHRRKSRQTDQHDFQIALPVQERRSDTFRRSVPFQVGADQRRPAAQKENRRQRCYDCDHPELEAHRLAHPLMVSLPEILRREDARTGHAAKNAQIVDKYQLVDDRHARHLFCADLPDHNVVKQADKVGDPVLYHDRHRDHQHHLVKVPVPNEFRPYPHNFLHLFCVRFHILLLISDRMKK